MAGTSRGCALRRTAAFVPFEVEVMDSGSRR